MRKINREDYLPDVWDDNYKAKKEFKRAGKYNSDELSDPIDDEIVFSSEEYEEGLNPYPYFSSKEEFYD